MKEILFLTDVNFNVIGYTENLNFEDRSRNYFLIQTNEEVLNDYLHYKIADGTLVRMADAEYEKLYHVVEPEPTFEEQQMDFNIEIDYRVACVELGIN